jgi:hypothetical protein
VRDRGPSGFEPDRTVFNTLPAIEKKKKIFTIPNFEN